MPCPLSRSSWPLRSFTNLKVRIEAENESWTSGLSIFLAREPGGLTWIMSETLHEFATHSIRQSEWARAYYEPSVTTGRSRIMRRSVQTPTKGSVLACNNNAAIQNTLSFTNFMTLN